MYEIKIRLEKTNLMVTRIGFGALPIQRVSLEEAKKILRKAYENSINFFDTARAYTDSEDNDCIECGNCKSKCPYKLDTPNLLKRELNNYEKFYAEHKE
ncbi:aldo/keto reductase [Thermoanaerobacterium butyriciformans]|uniref:Aldo/keto reductase-like oxidoreductase n=1 Tax=Thermoanaerobacterium butyriciformans TaxID=1702242 RepID=A0ABS4NCT2_9THEO|nr:aldo/keto reductase [Thermoanaerobacterium butyriciformans]MBP2071492.1 putative aldo/keto reductase-like oxidoreductase [Thermoanaerobacterium butyriciformans]